MADIAAQPDHHALDPGFIEHAGINGIAHRTIVNGHDRRVIRALGDVLLNPALLSTGGDKELDFKLCDGVSLGWLGLERQQVYNRGRAAVPDAVYAVPSDAAVTSYQALLRFAQTSLPETDLPTVRVLVHFSCSGCVPCGEHGLRTLLVSGV